MLKVGDKVVLSVEITEEMVQKFAEVSGDFNPIHVDEEYASKTRFKRRIAHGILSAALISRALGQNLGPGGIYLSQTLKFLTPVFIGDTVTVELTVSNIREERGIGSVETLVKNQNGELCVKGEAMIMEAQKV